LIYLWLLGAAYWIGQIISVWMIKTDHPDWHFTPCAVAALGWPYLVILRFAIQWGSEAPSEW
jgi:hypothetical protein